MGSLYMYKLIYEVRVKMLIVHVFLVHIRINVKNISINVKSTSENVNCSRVSLTKRSTGYHCWLNLYLLYTNSWF